MTVAIQFHCSKCGQTLRVEERHAGKSVRCPKCGAITPAPAPPTPTPTVPAPTPRSPARPAAGPPERAKPRAVPQEASEEDDSVEFASRNSGEADLDMTPMIDCVFLLLIFFTVTATYTLQKSFEIPPPADDKTVAQQRVVDPEEGNIIIRIDKDSTIWVNDSEAPSEQDLLVKLREAKQGVPGSDSPPINSLLVMADGDARHEVVVMALDAGNAVGMEPIKLATVDEDDF
jgi:biopolymer transport protein ExbD